MSNADEKLAFNAVNSQARQLGYRIAVELLANRANPLYAAYAHARGEVQAASAHFLCIRPTALAAAEDGLEILRGIVGRGEKWPDQT